MLPPRNTAALRPTCRGVELASDVCQGAPQRGQQEAHTLQPAAALLAPHELVQLQASQALLRLCQRG